METKKEIMNIILEIEGLIKVNQDQDARLRDLLCRIADKWEKAKK